MAQENPTKNISSTEIESAINRLRVEVCKRREQIQLIVPILFGGLYPAWQLQYHLKKPRQNSLKVDGGYDESTGQKIRPASIQLRPQLSRKFFKGRGLLIVDDIIGSGETLQKVLEIYPRATIAAATYWPSAREKFAHLGDRLILGQELPQGQYVNFPWEKAHPQHAVWQQQQHGYTSCILKAAVQNVNFLLTLQKEGKQNQ